VNQVAFAVPLVPPSVNHYVKHTRHGRHYLTREGLEFKRAVAILARGRSVAAKRYELEAVIYLGHGKRGDGDNFWKVIADGLVEARVIHSDAAVEDWILRKRRDPDNPRTEITVRAKVKGAHES
jgi:Holliday junction resolvase RusA-like endonuclease